MTEDESVRRDLIEIDVSDVSSIHELHQKLASALGFPDFYGNNWNAFWDAITGLVEMPRRLVVHGWHNIIQRWPNDAKTMAKCLHDLNEQFPTWSCDYELRG